MVILLDPPCSTLGRRCRSYSAASIKLDHLPPVAFNILKADIWQCYYAVLAPEWPAQPLLATEIGHSYKKERGFWCITMDNCNSFFFCISFTHFTTLTACTCHASKLIIVIMTMMVKNTCWTYIYLPIVWNTIMHAHMESVNLLKKGEPFVSTS